MNSYNDTLRAANIIIDNGYAWNHAGSKGGYFFAVDAGTREFDEVANLVGSSESAFCAGFRITIVNQESRYYILIDQDAMERVGLIKEVCEESNPRGLTKTPSRTEIRHTNSRGSHER